MLVHPKNRYLTCLDTIASLAFDSLVCLLQENSQLCIEVLLYEVAPVSHSEANFQVVSWREKIIRDIVAGLKSQDDILSVSAWKFLVSLRRTPQNEQLANSTFQEYLSQSE